MSERLTSRELEIICRECTLGQKHTLKGKKYEQAYKEMQESVDLQLEHDIPVMIPSEWPDVGGDTY
jgi:hypothetical protein